uniref:Uncharacterized protein AlNc14C36G3213 n=1 Tax=Albugo laibachii Nc14 TaxID=890382 RepID=F0W8T9_9STRA|nr:conserved hypothetical protein [Albugo laibachii Nc14]|eukprot:CCA17548.1 conserved hypothetical protein [Albugo laibachii Nc14]
MSSSTDETYCMGDHTASTVSSHSYDHWMSARAASLLHKGYLSSKKSIMKTSRRKFYFLAKKNPRLFAFKDESCFERWVTSDRVWNSSSDGDGINDPKLVCVVIRADRAVSDSNHNTHGVTILEGPASKFISRSLMTTSRPACDAWLDALRRIQLRNNTGRSVSSVAQRQPSEDPRRLTNPSASRVVCNDRRSGDEIKQRSPSFCKNQTLKSTNSDSSAFNGSVDPKHSEKVLLFVPGAVSPFSASESQLAEAKAQLEKLVAEGHRRPTRRGLESNEIRNVAWRYGVPNFIIHDLAYLKGKTRCEKSSPLESYIENYCQTYIMDATCKSNYSDWTSVHQDQFFVQVNDGDEIAGSSIQENDTFGFICLKSNFLGGIIANAQSAFSQAFTKGFPMEVLEVFTQPPRCHFSWRHWGSFSGRYKGVKGDGRMIQLFGFGSVEIDAHRMVKLRLYYKISNLIEKLEAARDSLSQIT